MVPHAPACRNRRAIAGDIGVLRAAQKLSSLRHTLVGDARDEDWDVFVGIDSETDHLPLEEDRNALTLT